MSNVYIAGGSSTGGVISFNGRVGIVVPAANDYSHDQLSGVTADQHHNKVHTHANSGEGGTVAHSALTGLTTGDDHTQYRLESEDHTHAFSGLQGGVISTSGPDADIAIDVAGAAGTAGTEARSQHGHKLSTSNTNPVALGSATPGTSGVAPSRYDHVHPTTGLVLTSGGLTQLTTRHHTDLDDVSANQHHNQLHESAHISGGGDAFVSTDLLEAIIKRIQESTGPTTLTVGNVTDGQYLRRVGTTIVSGDPAGGVTSVFGRTGAVVAASNDYSHNQLSGVTSDQHHAVDHDHDGSPTQKLLAANTHETPSADTHHATDHDHDGSPTQQLLAANTHGIPAADTHHNQLHEAAHISGAGDAFTSTQLLEAQVKRILESSGPTALTVGAVVDGEYLKRSGSTIISGAASGAVTSVFGRTGVVIAVTNDYTWAQIDKSTSSIADITTKTHSLLSGLTTGNDHTQYALLTGATFTGDVLIQKADASNALKLESTTGTNLVYLNLVNGAGAFIIGRDNSTGALTGIAYASMFYSIGAYPIVFMPNGTVRMQVDDTGMNLRGGVCYGDVVSGGNLTLQSTSHATRGKILFGTSAYDEVNNRLGIGTSSPGTSLAVVGTSTVRTILFETDNTYDFGATGASRSRDIFIAGKFKEGIVPRARMIVQSVDVANTTNWTTGVATIGTSGSITVATGSLIMIRYNVRTAGNASTQAMMRLAQTAGTATIKEVNNSGPTISSSPIEMAGGQCLGLGQGFAASGVVWLYVSNGGTATLVFTGLTVTASSSASSNAFTYDELYST